MSMQVEMPEIKQPYDFPTWLVEGMSGQEDHRYGNLQVDSGHDRKRPVYTATPLRRRAYVHLTEHAHQLLKYWWDYDLAGGSRMWAARIRWEGLGNVWFAARFESQLVSELILAGTAGRRYKVTADLILYGEPQSAAPTLTSFGFGAQIPLVGRAEVRTTTAMGFEGHIPLDGMWADTAFGFKASIPLIGTVYEEGILDFGFDARIPLISATFATTTSDMGFEARIPLMTPDEIDEIRAFSFEARIALEAA